MYLIKIMDGKLEEFFSLPAMKRKNSVQINTKVELPVQKYRPGRFVYVVPRIHRNIQDAWK